MKSEFDELMGVFIDEAGEYVDLLDEALVELEKHPADAVLLGLLMRTAHNLKGASGTVGLETISEGMHGFESVLKGIESGSLPVSEQTFALLFGLIDGLREALENLGRSERDLSAVEARIPQLAALLLPLDEPGEAEATEVDANPFARFSLGEFDRIRVDVCLNRGLCLYVLSVQPSVAQPAEVDWISWNREVHQTLREHGDIIATEPPSVELERIAEMGRMLVMFASQQTAEQLRQNLSFTQSAGLETLDGPHEWISEVDFPSEPQKKTAGSGASGIVAGARAHDTIRVSLDRIDSLVEFIGELVVVESMVSAAPELQAVRTPRLRTYLGQLTKITRDIQEVGMQMRMVPVRGLFKKMRRIVRDVAKDEGKEIRFVTTGESSEIDRSMVEQLGDPLVHLIRNAVDHGIEPVAERRRLGKPEEGLIRLSASHQGGKMVIVVTDDGAGLHREKIVARALAEGLIADGSEMSDDDVFDLIFTLGFSTALEVTEVSGRGVGMDVVKRDIDALQGRVLVSSEQGRGTTFELILPLTLAIIDGMLVQVGAERYILPTLSILESIQPVESMLHTFLGGYQVMKLRDETIPLVYLGEIFHVDSVEVDPCRGLVVVVETGAGKLGIVVDNVLVQQQIVIKSVGYGLGDTRYLAGAAILSDGAVGLIVNVDELAKLTRRADSGGACRSSQAIQVTGGAQDNGTTAEGE